MDWILICRENHEKYSSPLFHNRKTNLPTNYTTFNGLKTSLNSIRSEIMDNKNRNSEKCNLPPDEIDALKQLIQLQKDRVSTIKSADKGAGIVILNFSDYMN